VQFLFMAMCRLVFRIYCPLRVSGRENLPDSPFILCSNHSSHLDCEALMVASGRPFREFAMVAAKHYFFDRRRLQYVINLLLTLIPIERQATRRQLEEHVAACRAFIASGGRGLIIFPEGTRTRTGQMQPFKRGPAVVATALELPLVPAYIEGSFQAWPKGRWFIRPHRIQVYFGRPIPAPVGVLGETKAAFDAYRQVTAELEQQVISLKEMTRYGEQSAAHEVVGLGGRAD
jgi:1-acyl-sn-glycerol-3-phosphate acyltransferase/long-chain acyl-CoA synthetase